jgi:hypothetical protein
MPSPELTACGRCGAPHGRPDEPPLDWAPVTDSDGLIKGIVCPACAPVTELPEGYAVMPRVDLE